jgi:site-specific DNA recombinase
MFAGGSSPRAIAKILNDECVPGPDGRQWSDTTIRGHAERRTGILRNDLCQGKLVWNKQRYVKDPRTGKRLARVNPKSAWIVQEAPGLRIVDDGLWTSVQKRPDSINASPGVTKAKAKKFWESRRHKHLLTGIAACSECGGSLTSVGKDYMACSRARRSGTCSNKTSIRRSILEGAVLSALKDNLMQPHLVEEFVVAYHEEINTKAANASAEREVSERQLTKVRKQIDAIIDSIANGYRSESMKQRLEDLEASREHLERQIAKPEPTKVRFHPRLSDLYRRKVERLADSLSEPGIRDEAVTLLRELIDEVKVSPTENGWDVEIKGEVGRMVNLAEGKTEQNQCSVKVVAGTRNRLKLLLKTRILSEPIHR